jgi:hypothetical protein
MAATKEGKPLSDIQKAEFDKLSLHPNRSVPQENKYKKYLIRVENEGKVDAIGTGGVSKLKDIYIREKWHKEVISVAKDYVPAVLNGTLSEHKSLALICELDGVGYKKHKALIKNRYLKGILDCYLGTSLKRIDKVTDIKTAASMQSLLYLIKDEETKSKYYWQIMGYLAITGAQEGEVCHCLVSYSERIINDEINKFLQRTKNLGFDGDYIEAQIHRIKFNMTFDEIPIEQRVVRFKVERDEDAIKNIYEKVKFCRKWLNNFDKMHINMNI